MEKDQTNFLYLKMFTGTIGLILLIIGAFKYLQNIGGTSSYILLFGYIFMINYIHYLESKAGISKKLIWIRSAVLILTAILLYFLGF